MAASPVLVARQLGKVYGSGAAQVVALRGVDLDLAEGEIGRASCRDRV